MFLLPFGVTQFDNWLGVFMCSVAGFLVFSFGFSGRRCSRTACPANPEVVSWVGGCGRLVDCVDSNDLQTKGLLPAKEVSDSDGV